MELLGGFEPPTSSLPKAKILHFEAKSLNQAYSQAALCNNSGSEICRYLDLNIAYIATLKSGYYLFICQHSLQPWVLVFSCSKKDSRRIIGGCPNWCKSINHYHSNDLIWQLLPSKVIVAVYSERFASIYPSIFSDIFNSSAQAVKSAITKSYSLMLSLS